MVWSFAFILRVDGGFKCHEGGCDKVAWFDIYWFLGGGNISSIAILTFILSYFLIICKQENLRCTWMRTLTSRSALLFPGEMSDTLGTLSRKLSVIVLRGRLEQALGGCLPVPRFILLSDKATGWVKSISQGFQGQQHQHHLGEC